MPMPDVPRYRLHLDTPLQAGAVIPLAREQANYLLNVLRLKTGDAVAVFNGREGEWRATIAGEGRKSASLTAVAQLRPQSEAPDLLYLFAPLKQARLDYLAQKAVEMGVGVLQPVLTRRTQPGRLNLDRLTANAIEAAEQCGILSLPRIAPEIGLAAALQALEPERLLVFCDEAAAVASPVEALSAATPGPLAVLIGPEGGFDETERALIMARPLTLRISLGPRILRADTAAVAVLALVQAILGDWTLRKA